MILTREDYCIPFKEVLSLHNEGWDLESVYEIVLMHHITGELKAARLGFMQNRNMAYAYARSYYRKDWEVIDTWCIVSQKDS